MTCAPTALVYQCVLVGIYLHLCCSMLPLSSPSELLLTVVNYNFVKQINPQCLSASASQCIAAANTHENVAHMKTTVPHSSSLVSS